MEKYNHKYGAEQIQVLEGLEAVRKRPGMYIGSTSVRGLHHMVYEIVDNGVDEALAGYCTEINVIIEKGNIITVIDNGRGIPVEIHPKTHISTAETVYTVLHAGGKFGGDSGYKVSGGLHGVGASVVNALSSWTEVTIQRDGGIFEMKFEKGKTTEKLKKIGESKKTGTKVKAAVSRRGVVFVKLRSLGVLTSYLFIGKVFDVFEKYKVPVYLATSSNVSVSLAVKCSNDTLRLIYRELHKYAEIGMETEMSVVSVIGDLNWEKHTGLEARIIETLKEMPVCMISYGSSTHNLSVLVREQDREKALMTLCKAFLDIPSEKFDVIKQTQLQDSFVM